MFEVPRDTGVQGIGRAERFHRDWFYMEIYGHKDFELTNDHLETRVNDIYDMLSDWQNMDEDKIGEDKQSQQN